MKLLFLRNVPPVTDAQRIIITIIFCDFSVEKYKTIIVSI